MPAVEIRPFRRADRDQVAALVNAHAAAVVPGVAASVNAVLSQFEREPGEPLVDPWVAERRALVGEQDGGVVAAALVVRYRDDADVGPGYRGTAEIRWLLFRPEAPAGNPFWHDGWEAARRLLSTCLEVAAAWGVPRVGADGALPVPGVYGVPDSWPHVERLYREAGFTAPADAVEAVHLADLERLPVLAPVAGLQVRRNVGINGVRFTAALDGADVGYIEVDVLDGAERHPRVGGIADVGNLEVVAGAPALRCRHPARGGGRGVAAARSRRPPAGLHLARRDRPRRLPARTGFRRAHPDPPGLGADDSVVSAERSNSTSTRCSGRRACAWAEARR